MSDTFHLKICILCFYFHQNNPKTEQKRHLLLKVVAIFRLTLDRKQIRNFSEFCGIQMLPRVFSCRGCKHFKCYSCGIEKLKAVFDHFLQRNWKYFRQVKFWDMQIWKTKQMNPQQFHFSTFNSIQVLKTLIWNASQHVCCCWLKCSFLFHFIDYQLCWN